MMPRNDFTTSLRIDFIMQRNNLQRNDRTPFKNIVGGEGEGAFKKQRGLNNFFPLEKGQGLLERGALSRGFTGDIKKCLLASIKQGIVPKRDKNYLPYSNEKLGYSTVFISRFILNLYAVINQARFNTTICQNKALKRLEVEPSNQLLQINQDSLICGRCT